MDRGRRLDRPAPLESELTIKLRPGYPLFLNSV
jgi:hypothetical protein